MSEERVKVLEMLAAGKITIDQANELIEALSGAGESAAGRRYAENAPHEGTTTVLEPQQTPVRQDFSGMLDTGALDLTKGQDESSTQQDLHITSAFTLHGRVPGNVTVASGGHLILHGRVAQNLILEHGASIEFYGSVGRDFYNRSGSTVDLKGLVEGNAYNAPDSRINLHGQVRGDIYSRTENLTVFSTITGKLQAAIESE